LTDKRVKARLSTAFSIPFRAKELRLARFEGICAAAGLVLFGKRCRFLKRVDGADARIGRMPIEIGFHAQENRAMIPSDVFLIRFSRFLALLRRTV
jgi:hypothetical protein